MSLSDSREPLLNNPFVSRPMSRASTVLGLACLLVTCFGWGLNWPLTKFLLQQCPPLSARGVAGLASSLILAAVALLQGETMRVPRAYWPVLWRASLLNVSAWMGLTTLSLLWLSAGEAATLAYTMPIWTTLLAWPVLGERLSKLRLLSLMLGVAGVLSLLFDGVVRADSGKVPGVVSALLAAVLFGLGAVLTKRAPLPLTPLVSVAWQIGLGCLPLLTMGLVLERPNFATLSALGWGAIVYTALMSMGLCYLAWFAALRRLPAGVASLGIMLTPVIGVAAATLTLGEPLRAMQILALGLVAAAILVSLRG